MRQLWTFRPILRRRARLFATAVACSALLATATHALAAGAVTITPLEGKLRVDIDGQLFTEYCYREYAKPILYPVIGPHEIGMTRNYPMKKVAGEAHDHPHQKSMWFTHGSVNGVDFWSEGDRAGKIVSEKVEFAVEPDRAVIEATNRWVGPSGDVVCTDTRRIAFSKTAAARVIDWDVTVHASHGDLVFGDTKEGTMGIRTNPALRLTNDPRQGVTGAVGKAANSEGDRDAAVWGKRARWVDYWAKIDGNTVGIAIFDHPGNPRHPTWWHARTYGLIAANPFGIHNFENKPAGTGDMKIPAGQSIRFRYRFVFHEGDLAEAHVAQQYDRYAAQEEQPAPADPGRVLPPGQKPRDRRLGPLKDLNGYFPFSPPESQQAWAARADQVRRRLLVATGLWPLPPRRPPRAVVHGRVDRDGYTVEKVYLESYPGHFVTGNLYRPKGGKTPRPAVLSPHGHFRDGRYYDRGPKEIRQRLVEGAERFEVGGRYPIQARCVQLARMGCVVLQYDMLGYGDSCQIPAAVAHGHAEPRPAMESRQDWGFFSAQAELRLQSVMGLQTYNSLCALDWLASLADVDPQRIGVTGASGGGTQTMILCGIDPRPAVSFPAVMVSTAMQGGCTCENACCLRVGTGNVEFAALFAPKPLGLTAANDWTKEIVTKGLPELKQLYRLLGAEDHVLAKALTYFPHNYNYVSRAVMYGWMNKHLQLGGQEPVVEEDFKPLTKDEMAVWDDDHPRPPGGADYERALLRTMTEATERQMAELVPRDAPSLAAYRDVVGAALATIVGRSLPQAGAIERTRTGKEDKGDYFLCRDLLRDAGHEEELPLVVLQPKAAPNAVTLWFDGRGKAGLWDDAGQLRPEVHRLLEQGNSVVSADLLYQGEFLAAGAAPPTRSRKVQNPRDSAAYTFGYNPTLFAERVRDILSVVAFVRHDEAAPAHVAMIGLHGAGPWVAAARALAGDAVDAAAVDTEGFRFANLTDWRDVSFLPGAVKYGDLPALLALSAPQKLWIGGEDGQLPGPVAAAYQAAASQDQVASAKATGDTAAGAAVAWLLAAGR